VQAGPSHKVNKDGFLYFDLGVDEIDEDMKKCSESVDLVTGKDHPRMKEEFDDIMEMFKTFKFDVKSWDIYKSYGNQIPGHALIKLTTQRGQIIKAIEWIRDDLHYSTAEQEMLLDEMAVLSGQEVLILNSRKDSIPGNSGSAAAAATLSSKSTAQNENENETTNTNTSVITLESVNSIEVMTSISAYFKTNH